MIRYLDSKNYGRSNLGWLNSRFHFSFAEYYNPKNMKFGVLRVLNDDIVEPGTGFDTHPHKDMEIISYVVSGELTHADSMGNKETLVRGQVQYMSAGTGVFHSEHNLETEKLRFLQMWILPDKLGYPPTYGDHKFKWEDRKGKWLPVASGDGADNFPIQIHADVHIYVAHFKRGETLHFDVKEDKQAYVVVIEGELRVNTVSMEKRDALEVIAEKLTLETDTNAHVLIIEMKKEG